MSEDDKAQERVALLNRRTALEKLFDFHKDLQGGLSQAELDEHSMICEALKEHE